MATRETFAQALERFEDVLAFHYPAIADLDGALVDDDVHPRMVSQMADAFIDSLPVTAVL